VRYTQDTNDVLFDTLQRPVMTYWIKSNQPCVCDFLALIFERAPGLLDQVQFSAIFTLFFKLVFKTTTVTLRVQIMNYVDL